MAGVSEHERKRSAHELVRILHHCSELEQWGMIIEASEELLKVSYKLQQLSEPESAFFTPEEKPLLFRIAAALQTRARCLQDLSSVQEPSCSTIVIISKIITALEGLSESSLSVVAVETELKEVLPSDLDGMAGAEERSSATLADDQPLRTAQSKAGSLVSEREMLPGLSYLTIKIDKFGVKDPQNHLDPFFTISVKNFHGDNIEDPQDTPVASQREASHINFGVPVLLITPLEELPEGTAIFFEFKHYKPKKRKVSTKCFSFMEMDEMKPGKAALEIYKKPTDFHRKKLFLLSAKPLYLELTLIVDKPS